MEENEFAISTAWNYQEDTKKIFDEILKLGFNNIELGFHFDRKEVKYIYRIKKKLRFNIVSIHNFCPFPINNFQDFPSPDIYSLSSPDEEERKLAVKYGIKTVKTANEFGAKFVIFHAGKVAIEDETNRLAEIKKQDRSLFLRERDNYLKERNKLAEENIDSIKFSLDEILKFCEKYKIKICLETRYYLSEFPELFELEIILNEFNHPQICYWHDCGHAGVRNYLEIYSQKDYLDILGKFLIGFHFHDIYGIDDHLPPGKGEIDFSVFRQYIDKIKVLEIHPPATARDILDSRLYLEEIFK
jgi:sugar phosphate isomerase/epimerase